MRCAILCPLAALLLPAVLATPLAQNQAAPAAQVDGLSTKASTTATLSSEDLPTSTLAIPSPTPTPESQEADDSLHVTEPPPIFDPPEARPESIFDTPPNAQDSILKPPPIPAHRMEHLSLFDGAHAHPEVSVYQADLTDIESASCSWQLRVLKIFASLVTVIAVAFVLVCIGESVFGLCRRALRGRSRSGVGQIRLEETTLADGFQDKETSALTARSSLSALWPRSRSPSKTNVV